MATTRVPLWTWGHRIELTGYILGIGGGTGLAVAAALERDWLRLVLLVAVVVAASMGLAKLLRRGSTAQREVEEKRRRAAENAARAMTPARIVALAAEHRLDVGTAKGRVALVKVLRRTDPRLGLMDAKSLVDDVCR